MNCSLECAQNISLRKYTMLYFNIMDHVHLRINSNIMDFPIYSFSSHKFGMFYHWPTNYVNETNFSPFWQVFDRNYDGNDFGGVCSNIQLTLNWFSSVDLLYLKWSILLSKITYVNVIFCGIFIWWTVCLFGMNGIRNKNSITKFDWHFYLNFSSCSSRNISLGE